MFRTQHLFSLLFLGFLIPTAFGQTPDYVPTDGLVGWYDLSPSDVESQDGEVTDGIFSPNRFGQADRAVTFNGGGNCQSTCLGVTFPVEELVQNNFSFAVWAKPGRYVNEQPESSACSPTSVPMANSNQNWALYANNGGYSNFGVGLSVGKNGVFLAEHANFLLVCRLAHSMSVEGFVHVVVVYDDNKCSMYVNGELVRERDMYCNGSDKLLTKVDSYNEFVPLKLAAGLYSPRFDGTLDDFGFWNRSLDEQEIENLYNAFDTLGCTDALACNYDPEAATDDDSCIYIDSCGVCDGDNVTCQGCTDPTACNYDFEALVDNGLCVYPVIGEDCLDGAFLCSEGTWWHPGEQRCFPYPCQSCPGDFDDDFTITVTDLLGMLANFGSACSFDGCTDGFACNYDALAILDDGSCVYGGVDNCGCVYDCDGNLINDTAGDGLCDEVASEGCMDASACNYDPDYQCEGGDSNCIYGFEEPGSSCDDGDDNTILDVWNTTGCECTGQPAVDPAGEGPCAGENSLTYNGQDYGLLEVGDHCWFRENLRTTQFANGESIPLVEVDSVWANTDGAARSPFNGEPGNSETFGELYNWHAVSDDRGLCPAGWRVPGDTMWMNLEAALGMDSAAVLETGLRGTGVGEQLKASEPVWNGTDVSGFTALPGGFRTNLGSFLNQTILGYWWSTKPDSPHHAWYRGLSSMNDGVQRNIFNRQAGLSVRCVKGEQPVLCNNEPGAVCDDGDANTFNDDWDDSGCACAGTDAVLLDGSGPCEGQGSVDYFDQTYLLVEIGDQCWFRENLATEQFRNGDSILVVEESNWTTFSPRMAYLFNEPTNRYVFGGLYNWGAVSDERGLCPTGWHEPNYSEYAALKNLVEDAGGNAENLKMQLDSATTGFDWIFGNQTNTTGFSALPGGERDPYTGEYLEVYERAYFWTASQSATYSYSGRKFNLNPTTEITFNTVLKYRGASVRCVKGDLAPGCTDPEFVEFDLGAEVDDGSCLTPN